jgi:hypothetical protein
MFSQITTKSSVSVQRYFLPEDIYLSACSGTETTFLIIMSPAILQSRVFIKFVLKVGVEELIVNAPLVSLQSKTQTTQKVRLDLNS